MAKVQGMKCKVYVTDASDTALAGQKNASLKRSADTIDTTSKDSAGYWKENLAGWKEWSIDCDGAFIESDTAYQTLENSFVNGDAVNVYIELPSGIQYSGSAVITDAGLDLPYDDLVTYSFTFQGTGALDKVTGT